MTGLLDIDVSVDGESANVFFRAFDQDNDKKLKFSDFSKAFLPWNNKEEANQILKREPRNLKREKHIRQVFKTATIIKYGILFKTLMNLLREIEDKKKVFGQANCYDFERIFFDMDTYRKGFIEKENVRVFYVIL